MNRYSDYSNLYDDGYDEYVANQKGRKENQMDKDNETGAVQIVTSEYNKLRTEEYLHLRERFYKRFPKSLESDYEFEQEIFLHYDILQAEIKQLEKLLALGKESSERRTKC